VVRLGARGRRVRGVKGLARAQASGASRATGPLTPWRPPYPPRARAGGERCESPRPDATRRGRGVKGGSAPLGGKLCEKDGWL